MNNEIWKPILHYEDLYEVSSLGRVKVLSRTITYHNQNNRSVIRTYPSKILKPTNSRGYLRVSLNQNGKIKKEQVHRLVAQAFIPNPNQLPEVNHKDENKLNNYVGNLEWCTSKYNCNYGTRNIRLSTALKGRHFTDEWKQKLSQNKIGITLSEIVKQNISSGHKGITFTEEHKKKISQKLRDYKTQTIGKKVKQIDISNNEIVKIWDSLRAIEYELGFAHNCISRACQRENNIYKNFKWEFLESEAKDDGKGDT